MLRIRVILAKLRTAVVVGVNAYIVQVRAVALLLHALGNSLCLTIHATHRRNDPQLVADTHRVVLSQVTHHLQIVALRVVDLVALVIVGVLQVIVQVGLQVVRVDPTTHLDSGRCMADRITIFDDILTLGNGLDGKLVTTGNILLERNLSTVDLNHFTRLQIIGNGYGHVIHGIDFQKSFHLKSLCFLVLAKEGRCALAWHSPLD